MADVDRIVREVGAFALQSSRADHDITLKNEPGHTLDFATVIDVKCEEMLVERLGRIDPASAFVAEEGHTQTPQGDRMWIIDPIDGTNNYYNGLPAWGVNVAWAAEGQTQAAWTYLPVADEMFEARLGEGARRNGETLRVSSRGLPMAVLGMGLQPRTLKHAPMAPWMEVFSRVRAMRISGSIATELAWTAAGRLDGVLAAGHVWDVAPGLLLVSEAGGTARTLGGDVRDPFAMTPSIAGPAQIVQAVLACFGVETEADASAF